MKHVHFILTNPNRRRSTLYDRPDPSSQFRLAIGSYVEQYSNSVQIVKKHSSTTSTDDLESQLYQACEFDHPYPCTKISWSPDAHNQGGKDLLATTGDYLRLWNFTEDDSSGKGKLAEAREQLQQTQELLQGERSKQPSDRTLLELQAVAAQMEGELAYKLGEWLSAIYL